MKRILFCLLMLGCIGCGSFWPRDTALMKRRVDTPFGGHEILRIGETTNYVEIVTPQGVLRINPPQPR